MGQDRPTAFEGFEPVVGVVRAVRSFRVGPDGELHPLFHDTPWTTPVVTASCLLHDGDDHVAPDAECACGLYAYSGVAAAREDPHSRRVLGVVSCWGRVVAGTRGLRAQHARIEALWISRRVPDEVVDRVRTRHPWVIVFRDRSAMLTMYAPTRLDCYEPDRERLRRRALALAVVASAAVAVLPQNWEAGRGTWWLVQLAAFTAAVVAAVPVVSRVPGAGRAIGGAGLLLLATAVWLAAPFGGTLGEVLVRGGVCVVGVLGAMHRVSARRRAVRIPASVRVEQVTPSGSTPA